LLFCWRNKSQIIDFVMAGLDPAIHVFQFGNA
jgi:hypothetical protein